MSSGGSHEYPVWTQTVHPPGRMFNPYPFTTITRNNNPPAPATTILTSEPDILTLRGTEIISQNATGPIYALSSSTEEVGSELILSSLHEPLYKIEYLGDKNALYIRPAQEEEARKKQKCIYPGFGELKHGSNILTKSKVWTVKYGDGKDLVLSCKDGAWTENASGHTIAIERRVKTEDGGEEEEIEFLVESDVPDRGGMVEARRLLIKGLVVVSWVGRCWHAGTLDGRNESDSKVSRDRKASFASGSSGRRNMNRFMGGLFSGGSM